MLFTTQEIGSVQRPMWRQKLESRPGKQAIAEAVIWGKRLGVSELDELVNSKGTGLLQIKRAYSDEEKERIVRIASIYVIRMLEIAGLDRIFDGEQHRTEMYDTLARRIEGIETAGTLNSFDANYFRKGSIEGRISLAKGATSFFADEFSFIRAHTNRVVKPCLTGPYTMMDWSYLEHYRRESEGMGLQGKKAISAARSSALNDFALRTVNPILKRLSKAGASVVQIDEPAAATDERESAIFVDSINRAFSGLPSGVEKAVHLCYSDYSSLFPAIADCVADSYLIEFTNHASPTHFRPEDVDKSTFNALKLFKEYGIRANIGIGVIDIHSDLIETPQVIRDRILYASKVLGDEALIQVNPDCGLRTRRWDVAFPKLCNMVEGTMLARSEFGV